MSIFTPTVIQTRRERVASAWAGLLNGDDLVLIFCGSPLQKPGGLDQTYFFLPHPEYYWLTGSRRPNGVVAYSKNEGWVDFVEPITLQEKLWEGGGEAINGLDVKGLEDWLSKSKFQRTFRLGQTQQNSKDSLFAEVQEAFNRSRRPKDLEEIALIRKAAKAAERGYRLFHHLIAPGRMEREIQIEYEAEVLRAGADRFPYDTIVGSGVRAATLHAVPTDKKVESGELVLIDAGADIHDYCVDITRVFFADGRPSSRQKYIYGLVLKAQEAAIVKCQPQVEWHDVHRAAARVIAEGLKDLNLLKGSIDDLLESGAVSAFFPHGVGHMVGQRVRDVGTVFGKVGRECCGVRVRVDLPLEENFVMTAEPGIYFVSALLDQLQAEGKYGDHVQWSEVEKWKDFGGIRLEDDIWVTKEGPKNLTDLIEK